MMTGDSGVAATLADDPGGGATTLAKYNWVVLAEYMTHLHASYTYIGDILIYFINTYHTRKILN